MDNNNSINDENLQLLATPFLEALAGQLGSWAKDGGLCTQLPSKSSTVATPQLQQKSILGHDTPELETTTPELQATTRWASGNDAKQSRGRPPVHPSSDSDSDIDIAAAMAAPDLDPLLLLRQSIASSSTVIPTASDDASAAEVSLSRASHLTFTTPSRISLPIDRPTRFVSGDTPVDLRSIYFAWLKREVAIPEYNTSVAELNEAVTGKVQNLAFVERLDLITWLEGASEESEYIKPLAGDKDGATSSAAAALASKGAAAPAIGSTVGRSGKGTVDPRMAIIYNSERRMGDRNTVLRGIKPTDFSHVRKLAAPFMTKKPAGSAPTASIPANPTLAHNPKQKRPDPIILLSPSASSLLRMTNIKAFLDGGKFVPADSLTASSSSASASMLHINRLMKDIDPNRPMRFILVEGPEQFKPEYWSRVVAVFTTGQGWQFKNYKWSNPNELFRRVLGIYVGWRHEPPPEAVQTWGHRVMSVGVERWKDLGPGMAEVSRWRDREVVEQIWKAIETNMKNKGWKRDQAPASI